MTQKEIYEKAQLLKSGLIVEMAGDTFRACKVAEGWEGSACEACELDSICRGDVFDVCCEMETSASHNWYLKLAHP